MGWREPTAAELAELDAPAEPAGRAPTADELAELNGAPPAPAGPGPFRDSPSFSTTPPPASPPPPSIAREPQGPPTPAPASKPSATEAFFMGAGQGATGGFMDEAAASLSTYGSGGGMNPNPTSMAEAAIERKNTGDPTGTRTYMARRDAVRAEDKASTEAHPFAHAAGNVAGFLLSPMGKIGAGGGALARIAGTAGQGALGAAGESEADLMKGEVAPLLLDTAKGGAVGAGVGAAVEGARAGVKGVAKLVTGDLKRRILNEVAEGTANVSQTERKRLEQAGEAIVREVTTGPDAKLVREAYAGRSAAQGLERIGEVVNQVADRNAAHYDAFVQAGRGKIIMSEYLAKLDAARQAALEAGDKRLADALVPIRKGIVDTAKQTGGMTLERLRALTTQAQETAANALGSLLERQNAKVARRAQGVVTAAMDDTLAEAAHGVPGLEKSVDAIRYNNKRLHALLTISDALEVRARKEGSLPGVLVRGAQKLASPAMLAGAGALLGGDENRAAGAIGGAALGLGAVPLARAIERGVTTMGIKAAQNPQAVSAASRVAGAMARIGGGYAASRRRDEDQP